MTDRPLQFYSLIHQALGREVQTDDSLAIMTEAHIMHTLQAGYHCIQEKVQAEAKRDKEMEQK